MQIFRDDGKRAGKGGNRMCQEPRRKTPNVTAWRTYGEEIFASPVIRNTGYVIVLIMGVLGVLCLFFVDFTYKLLPYIMGGFMAGTGVLAIAGSVLSKEYMKLETKLSSSGILMFVIGIAIIVRGGQADGLIGVAWGILGLIQGSESLNVAIYNLAHKKKWPADMLQAAVQITPALLLLVDPASKLYPHMQILGLELLAMGFHLFRKIRASC